MCLEQVLPRVLEERLRLAVAAEYATLRGEAAISTFADGRRALAALEPPAVAALRETRVTVSYEGKHSARRPVLGADGGMCWNPGDACAVQVLRSGTWRAGGCTCHGSRLRPRTASRS